MMKKICGPFFIVAGLFSAGVAQCSYFDVNVGYKNACFERDVDITLIATGQPGNLKINYDDLTTVNLEINAKLAFTRCFYFRCRGDYGWIVGGHVKRETDIAALQPILNNSFDSHGHVANLDGGFGFTFYPLCNLDVGPVVGWGYSDQSITALVDGSSASFFSNRLWWIGPWLGVDLTYRPYSCISLHAEYEFHWVHYKDHHVDLPFGAPTLNFNYDDAIGNTLFVDGVYHCPSGWRIGLRFSVESWATRGDPDINAIALVPFPLSIEGEDNSWFSAGIQAKIGKVF